MGTNFKVWFFTRMLSIHSYHTNHNLRLFVLKFTVFQRNPVQFENFNRDPYRYSFFHPLIFSVSPIIFAGVLTCLHFKGTIWNSISTKSLNNPLTFLKYHRVTKVDPAKPSLALHHLLGFGILPVFSILSMNGLLMGAVRFTSLRSHEGALNEMLNICAHCLNTAFSVR